ncbi:MULTISPECIES: alpha/beta hydrolase [unclassified Bradyrhizobium]|uniref:alpha/beta fold hydrolase n=1 Tax=unclassified Bradyrhizobium TaxID=2631580 RepID=UPI001FF6FD6C|nr:MULTISPECIES: alpha/beta hydrolase [unclassified Bradyrhizobium]MCK1707731.1 alpha/beta hydrolase [Bradyrhizobium sp. 143]MCK1730032.1 alpha/beta hydrolase [Bradyrhizobium sp. 142]
MRSLVRVIKSLRLSYCEHKSSRGTAVLLIHGNSSSKDVFAKQVPPLCAGGYSFVIPDLPGHGSSARSETPRSTYSFPGYAAVLHALMGELGHRSYHVVGWSLGGHIGIEMMARYGAVKSLLVSGTPPVSLDPDGIAAGFNWTPSTALAGKRVFSREDAIRYVRAMMGARLAPAQQIETALRTDGDARHWMVRNGMRGVGADEVRTITEDDRPFAVVQGASDPFVRTDYLARLPYKNVWTGAPVFVEAGHAAHWQAPGVFNGNMMEFLRAAN